MEVCKPSKAKYLIEILIETEGMSSITRCFYLKCFFSVCFQGNFADFSSFFTGRPIHGLEACLGWLSYCKIKLLTIRYFRDSTVQWNKIWSQIPAFRIVSVLTRSCWWGSQSVRHSLLLLCSQCWQWFEPKILSLNSSLHKTCCC